MVRVTVCLALAASGLVALSSCSSGQPSSAGATSSAGQASPRSTGPIPAVVSAATGSVRIRLLTEVFATPLPPDPAKAKVIEGFRESQILWDQSSETLGIVARTTEYITGKALENLQAAVESGAKDNVALAGTDRLYDTSVASLSGDSATVTSCDDGSRTYLEDLASLQKIPDNPSAPLTFLVIWRMVPVGGHWAITSLDVISPPNPRASVCQHVR